MVLSHRNVAVAVSLLFAACGLSSQWMPTLRLVIYAFAAGCIAIVGCAGAIILLSTRSTQSAQKTLRRLQSAAFVKPPLWAKDTKWFHESARYGRKPFALTSLGVSESLDELFDWAVRDFVASWYGNISSSPAFVNEIDKAFRDVMVGVLGRIQGLDLVETVVLRFVPIITSHLKDFYDAEQNVRGKKLNRNVTDSEELDLAIAAKYRDGKLHPAVSVAFSDTKLGQAQYLRKAVASLLPKLVPEEIAQSKAVAILIREIVSCAVLRPLLQALSEPDTWNQILEAYGRTVLQDRKTVRKLRAALDAHALPVSNGPKAPSFPLLAPEDDERKFERFIRAIRQCNNLSDTRKFRKEVSSQLQREAMLEGQDRVYLRRLETGKRILDQRVGMLSAVGGSSTASVTQKDDGRLHSKMAKAGILEILRDASGLSYFMEYMDRLHLTTLVQFWVVVDGFRDPLEDDAYENSSLVDMPRQWSESDRLDIAQISDTYLTQPELKISSSVHEAVQEYLRSGRRATMTQYQKARSALLKAQTLVQENLEVNYLPEFRKSDLFFKLLASDAASTKLAPQTKTYPKEQNLGNVNEKLNVKSRVRAPSMSRTNSKVSNSTGINKSPSSSELSSALRYAEEQPPRARRSLDTNGSNPLFHDDVDNEVSSNPRRSFDEDPLKQPKASQEDLVQAVEAELTSIMTDDYYDEELRESFFEDSERQNEPFNREQGPMVSIDNSGQTEAAFHVKKERPNLASLGLVDTSSRIGFFRDDDLFEEERFLEDERAASNDDVEFKDLEDEVHEADPGDLGLAEAISALTIEIDRLVAQESIVDALTRKAELTNNMAELRILGKSKSSLQREIRRKELQRQQYIVQESDSSLFGRATININSTIVGKDDNGQEFALYVIEVNRKAGEHMPAASWAVARRYSEFHRLHQRLRQAYALVRNLDFPRRRLVMKFQSDFLHRRRASLEHYLRELLRLPAVCRARDLRAFLSQRPILPKDGAKGEGVRADIISRIYSSVTDGMDEFLGNIPVLDQLSLAGQTLISAATNQSQDVDIGQDTVNGPTISSTDAQDARAELEAFHNQTLEPVVKPICDLFLEAFELNRSPNWLRGRAVVVILQQLLGGTVERRLREVARTLSTEDCLLNYLALAKESIWPGGMIQREQKQRTEVEKRASRREASVVLAALVPELAGSVVGRANAQAAGRRLFATVNNARLNAHLIFCLLDEVIAVLFP